MYVVVYSPQPGRMGTRRARMPAVGPGRRVGRTVSTGSRVGGVTDGRHGAATVAPRRDPRPSIESPASAGGAESVESLVAVLNFRRGIPALILTYYLLVTR